MMPPVEVPAIRSNRSAVCLPVRSSRFASTIAGITPRIPPPSIDSTFIRLRPYFGSVPWVYLLRCADDSLYCGWTVDLDKRARRPQRRHRLALHAPAPSGEARLVPGAPGPLGGDARRGRDQAAPAPREARAAQRNRISTRRLSERPRAVSLDATGAASPRPTALAVRPLAASVRRTASARRCDSRRLYAGAPAAVGEPFHGDRPRPPLLGSRPRPLRSAPAHAPAAPLSRTRTTRRTAGSPARV